MYIKLYWFINKDSLLPKGYVGYFSIVKLKHTVILDFV